MDSSPAETCFLDSPTMKPILQERLADCLWQCTL